MDSGPPGYADGTLRRGLGAGGLPHQASDHHIAARMLPPPSLSEAPPGSRADSSARREFSHPSQHHERHTHTLPGLIQGAGHGSGSASVVFGQHAAAAAAAAPCHQSGPTSPSMRQNIRLSTSTTATTSTSNHSPTSADTTPTTTTQTTAGPSPTDDADAGEGKRMNRCRQGPLGPWQRQKAHLMRVLGACPPCKGSRTSCQPSHYGLEYDDAVRKYLGESPAPSPPPPQNTTVPSPDRPAYPPPPPLNTDQKRGLQELEKDISPTSTLADQPPRKSRKPLPGGPSRRLEKAAQDALSLPPRGGPLWSSGSSSSSKPPPPPPSRTPPRTITTTNDGYSPTGEQQQQQQQQQQQHPSPLNGYSPTPINGYSPKHSYSHSVHEAVQATSRAARMSVSNLVQFLDIDVGGSPTVARYDSVHVQMLCWEDEDSHDVKRTVDALRMVLEHHYHYSCEMDLIPAVSSSMWLVGKLQRFFSYQDQPNVLKILYYHGHSFMNRDHEQVLASSSTCSANQTIKWSMIQSLMEATISDTLVLLDSPFYGGRVHKPRGKLAMLASCDFGHYAPHAVPRGLFTHCLSENLRKRAVQTFRGKSLRVNELHVDIMCDYKLCIPDARTDTEALVRFPRPLYVQYGDGAGGGVVLEPLGLPPTSKHEQHGGGSGGSGAGSAATARVVAVEIAFDAGVVTQEELSRMIRHLPGVGDVRVGSSC